MFWTLPTLQTIRDRLADLDAFCEGRVGHAQRLAYARGLFPVPPRAGGFAEREEAARMWVDELLALVDKARWWGGDPVVAVAEKFREHFSLHNLLDLALPRLRIGAAQWVDCRAVFFAQAQGVMASAFGLLASLANSALLLRAALSAGRLGFFATTAEPPLAATGLPRLADLNLSPRLLPVPAACA